MDILTDNIEPVDDVSTAIECEYEETEVTYEELVAENKRLEAENTKLWKNFMGLLSIGESLAELLTMIDEGDYDEKNIRSALQLVDNVVTIIEAEMGIKRLHDREHGDNAW